MLKNNIALAILFFTGFNALPQLVENSPYSRFGLGNIKRPVSIFNESMGGVGTSLTAKNDINTLNPALLYKTSDVTFELGSSYNFYRATEAGAVNNSSNLAFDYINLAFPITPKYVVSVGLRPYSEVNYSTESITDVNNSLSIRSQYSGSGGINMVNFANSYTVLNDTVSKSLISLGLDGSLLVGKISRDNISTNIVDGELQRDQVDLRSITSYRGARLKLGAAFSKELFKGKALKIVPSCEDKSVKDTLMVNSIFYPDEIAKLKEKAYLTDYAIILPGHSKLAVSSKIKSEARRDYLFRIYAAYLKKGYGVYVLPEAEGVEVLKLKESYLNAVVDIKNGGSSKGVMSLDRIAKEYLRIDTGMNLSLGLAYELGGDLGVSGTTDIVRTDLNTNIEASSSLLDQFDGETVRLPQTIHFGLSLGKDEVAGRNYCSQKLKSIWALGADVSLTNWSQYKGFNVSETFGNTFRAGLGGYFTPHKKVTATEVKVGLARLLLKTNYRAGVYYQTLPYSVSGSQVTEIGTNVGFTFPASRRGSTITWNLGYSRRGTEVVENYFKLGLGLTIVDNSNSRWFKRYEVGL